MPPTNRAEEGRCKMRKEQCLCRQGKLGTARSWEGTENELSIQSNPIQSMLVSVQHQYQLCYRCYISISGVIHPSVEEHKQQDDISASEIRFLPYDQWASAMSLLHPNSHTWAGAPWGGATSSKGRVEVLGKSRTQDIWCVVTIIHRIWHTGWFCVKIPGMLSSPHPVYTNLVLFHVCFHTHLNLNIIFYICVNWGSVLMSL